MIEVKIIHYCWFGKNKMPNKIKKCINSWKKFFPDYVFMLWDENSFDISSSCQFVQDAYLHKKWAFVSDYVRFYALFNYGGLYMDTDVLVLKDFSDFVKLPFMIIGRDLDIAPGLITGCYKGDKFCKNMIDIYESLSFNINNIVTVNKIVTNYFVNKGFVREDVYQEVDGYHFYESQYFDPTDYINRITTITNDTFTNHLYYASWVPKKSKLKRRIQIIIEKVIGNENGNKLFIILKKIKDYFKKNHKDNYIGVVTFHRALNYGAQLQAYALSKYLKNYMKVEIVDYYPIDSDKLPLINRLYLKFKKSYRIRKLISFPKDNLPLSKEYKSKSSVNYSKYTMMIVGSDQVWNKSIIGNNVDYYSLKGFKGYKISYAASLKGRLDPTLLNNIKDFNRISLREKHYFSLFENFNNVTNECDPIFLLDKDDWLLFSSKVSLPKKYQNYILFFSLSLREDAFEIAYSIKSNMGLPIISLNIFDSIKRQDDYRISKYRNIGPKEFVWLIYNAKYIITDSFHATAFSILFNKRFTVLVSQDDYRIRELLSEVGYDVKTNIVNCDKYNGSLLNKKICSSKQYLKDCINECKKCM